MAKELPSPQHALEVVGVVVQLSEPVVVTQEIASDNAPATSDPEVVIVIDEGTNAITSPLVMMLEMSTPFCSLITELVSSHKFDPIFSFQLLSIFVLM